MGVHTAALEFDIPPPLFFKGIHARLVFFCLFFGYRPIRHLRGVSCQLGLN